MNEHLLKLLAAYAAGTAATALLVRVVWLLPIEHYAKHLLGWVLPLPAMLIVLVVIYYCPEYLPVDEAMLETRAGLIRVFILGTLSTFGIYASVPVAKYLYQRITGNELGEDDDQD
jgi:hypothetical protein